MIEKQQMPLSLDISIRDSKLPALTAARFKVSSGEILTLQAEVSDSVEAADKRGVLCAVRFFNREGEFIDLPYIGTALSTAYGHFVYIRSYHARESKGWQLSKLIVAPEEADTLEVVLYPFKASERIRLIGEVQCFALPSDPTVQYQYELLAGQSKDQVDDIYPFWSGLYSFSIDKAHLSSDDVQIKLAFVGQREKEVGSQKFLCAPVIGERQLVDDGVLVQAIEATLGGQSLEALVQIVPPVDATKVVLTVTNRASSESLNVSYKIHKFDTLIESRFDMVSLGLDGASVQLPYDVADLTFAELLRKQSSSVNILEAALDFYKVSGAIERVASIANHILSVSRDAALCAKARLALAKASISSRAWFPSPGKVGVTESAADKQLTVAHFMSTPDLDRICQKQDAEHVRAIAIMPLGYPKKGESGEPWERTEEEGVDCFFLNCVSAEQLELVPVTSQLNFMAVLAKDILRQEHVDLIHIHEDEASINSLLVGVALAKAFKIPLVYQKHTVVDEVVTEFDETKLSLAQAKLAREYQCMQMADAIIVQSEAQCDALIKAGIQQQKISILPLTEDVAKGYREVYELAQQTHLNKN